MFEKPKKIMNQDAFKGGCRALGMKDRVGFGWREVSLPGVRLGASP